jgi:dolichol-phosphate mannosyltransferase
LPRQLSIVTPVYRAANGLDELHRRLTSVLEKEQLDFEIVLVEDGSPDASAAAVERIARSDARVTGVLLSRNFGQHAAILAGIAEASGDLVVVMDCDLQDRPEDIPLLIAKLREGHDVVIARREARTTGFFKRTASRLWFWILNLFSDIQIERGAASFSILRRAVVDALLKMPNRNTHYQLVLRWLGFRQTYVTVSDGGRFEGTSTYSLRKLLSHAASGFVSHSTKLLHFSIYAGFLFVLLAIVQFGYVVFERFSHNVGVAGWASMMATIWFIGGAILFSLGVIGIYLSRLVDDVKERPPYVIARRIRGGE